MEKTAIGDRFKRYEAVSDYCLTRRTPVIGRLDGRAFHTLTRGCEKPFIKLLWEKELASLWQCTAPRLDLSYWCIRCHRDHHVGGWNSCLQSAARVNCRHPACQEALHGEVLGIGDS